MYNSQTVIRSFIRLVGRKLFCDEALPVADKILCKNSLFYKKYVPIPCLIEPNQNRPRSYPTYKYSKGIIEQFLLDTGSFHHFPFLRLSFDGLNEDLLSILSDILISHDFTVLCIFRTDNAKDFENSLQFLYIYKNTKKSKKYRIGYLDSVSDSQLSTLVYRLFPESLRRLPVTAEFLRRILFLAVQDLYGIVPTFIPKAEANTPTPLPLTTVHCWQGLPEEGADMSNPIRLSLNDDLSKFHWGYFYIQPFMAGFSSFRNLSALNKLGSSNPTELLLHTAALFCLYYQNPVCPYQNPTPNELDSVPSMLYILLGSWKEYSRIITPLFRSFPLFQCIPVKKNQSVADVLHSRERFHGITVFYFHGLPRALTVSECDRLLSFSKVTFLMNACSPKGYPHAVPLFLSCLDEGRRNPTITKKQWSAIQCEAQANYNKEKIDLFPDNYLELLPVDDPQTFSESVATAEQTIFQDFLCFTPSISQKQLKQLMAPHSIPDKWPLAFTYMVSVARALDKDDSFDSFYIAKVVCREAVLTYFQCGTFFPVALLCFYYFLSESLPDFPDSFDDHVSQKTLGWRKGQYLYLDYLRYYDRFTSWVHNRVDAADVYPYSSKPYLPERQRDFERMILAPEGFIQYASKPKPAANGKIVQPPIVFRRKGRDGTVHQFLRLKRNILEKDSFSAIWAQISHGTDPSSGMLYFSDIS